MSIKNLPLNSLFILLLLWTSSSFADPAWWKICTECQEANDFQVEAVNTSGGDGLVFVSNPDSLQTKKFNRFSTLEDFGTGLVRMTHVIEAQLTPQEQNAFRDALEKSQLTFATLDSAMVNAYAGVPDYPSAIFAIRNGRLGNSFFFGAQSSIHAAGMIPTRESVGASAGVNILEVISGQSGANETIRVVPLSIRVQYPDGSNINAVYHPDGSWSDVHLVDEDGNTIDIDVDSTLNPVIVASIVGDYMFAGEDIRDAVIDFVRAVGLSERPGGGCTWRELPDGKLELSCSSS